MKKTAGKIALILIVVFFACAFNGCVELIKMTADLVVGAVEIGSGLIETGAMIGEAAASAARAAKDEIPLQNLRRLSKGVYTVEISSLEVKYKEEVRNKAINYLVQILGYESYDFKMISEPNSRKKIYEWTYSVTMPGSIPVVRNDKYSLFKIADIGCTPVPDTTFGNINAIAYGDGKFVAVGGGSGGGKPVAGGGGGGARMAYSSDGINWTAVKNISTNFNDIAYGNDKFVAVGGGKMAYSSDGVNWTDVKNTSFKKDPIGSIAYGNGMFVAAAKYDNGQLAYSPDGINWTQVKSFPFRRKYINALYCKDKFFVIEPYDNHRLAYSSDGVNWTAMKSPFGKGSGVDNIVYGNDKFLAVGYRDTAYSSDGINWTAGANYIYVPFMGGNSNVNVLAYGDGKFVTGTGSKMAYSSDGINWITIADSATRGIKDIIYGNGKFIVVGAGIAYWDGNVE